MKLGLKSRLKIMALIYSDLKYKIGQDGVDISQPATLETAAAAATTTSPPMASSLPQHWTIHLPKPRSCEQLSARKEPTPHYFARTLRLPPFCSTFLRACAPNPIPPPLVIQSLHFHDGGTSGSGILLHKTEPESVTFVANRHSEPLTVHSCI